MEALILYFGKQIICSGVLFLYYQWCLKDKTFHHYNRFYLLSAVVISLLLPLVKVENFTIAVSNNVYLLMSKFQTYQLDNNTNNDFNYFRIILQALGVVSLFFLGKLLFGIYNILKFKKKFPKEQFGEIHFFQTDLEEAPFSYFKSLFWKKSILLHSDVGRQILKHEMVHIEQKHSYDKIFMEIIRAIFWFNPIFYFIKKELNLIHEYLADNKAVKQSDTKAFAQMLLASHFSGTSFPATSPFLSSNLKKRLQMIQKPKTKFGYARRIFALPVVFIIAFAYMVNAKNKEIKVVNAEIDAAVKMVNVANSQSTKQAESDENNLDIVKSANDTIVQPKVSNLKINTLSSVDYKETKFHPLRQKIVNAKANDVFLINGKKVNKTDYLDYFDKNTEVPNLVFSHSVPKSDGAQTRVFSVESSGDKNSQAVRNKFYKDNNSSNDLFLYLNKTDKTPEEKEKVRQDLLSFYKKSDNNREKLEIQQNIAEQRKQNSFDDNFMKNRDYEKNPLTKKEIQILKDDARKIEKLNTNTKTNYNYGLYNAKEYITKILDFDGKVVNTDESANLKIKTNKMMISTDGAELYVEGKKVNTEEFKKYQSGFKSEDENPKIKSFIIERVGDDKRSYAKKMEIITEDNARATEKKIPEDVKIFLNDIEISWKEMSALRPETIKQMNIIRNDLSREIRITTK